MSNNSAGQHVALVTGGAGGIGVAICRALAAAGHRVAVTDLQLGAARDVAASLDGSGHRAYALDVADEQSVAAAFDAITADMGRPEILVHGAGILLFKPDGDRPLIVETSLADWRRNLDVNLTGCFLVCREYARRLPAGPTFGRVVTLSSVAAQLGGYRSNAAYIASKAGILGFTKALARELAPQRVTVNAVAPGLIDAPMLRLSLPPERDQQATAAIPLNRLGLPADVAAAVVHLVSDEAGYQTGTTVDVNGGYRMQ